MLASRATLSSVGVGDADASPTAALLLSVLQESAGRIATILFAHRFGSALEPECKMYRLLADVLNDIGFALDCLSPAFPKPTRVLILSFSSVLRALCGVAAGSAKASLSAHFARWGNLGELNAKDSSQETVISLMGMLVGSLVVSWVTTPLATWTTLALLLSVHLETNRRAVRAVSMRTLNRQRATLVYHHLCQGHIPSPEEVSAQERIFERSGVLRAADDTSLGHCMIGSSFSDLLHAVRAERKTPQSFHMSDRTLLKTFKTYEDRQYVLCSIPGSRPCQVQVVAKRDATAIELLTAWWQALCLADKWDRAQASNLQTDEDLMLQLQQSMSMAVNLVRDNAARLRASGWDLDSNALETVSSSRVAAEL